jgi:hypothetical protein
MWWRATASRYRNSIELQDDGAAVPPLAASPSDEDEHEARLGATVYFCA